MSQNILKINRMGTKFPQIMKFPENSHMPGKLKLHLKQYLEMWWVRLIRDLKIWLTSFFILRHISKICALSLYKDFLDEMFLIVKFTLSIFMTWLHCTWSWNSLHRDNTDVLENCLKLPYCPQSPQLTIHGRQFV